MDTKEKLKILSQTQLLSYLEELTEEERRAVNKQIDTIDLDLFKEQQRLINSQTKKTHFTEYQEYDKSGNAEDSKNGRELIAKKAMGCLMLAGGLGSRLGFDGPKGCYPIAGKSLFERFALQIASIDTTLPLAIMTSLENDNQTRAFWEKHNYFGLKNVSFFTQEDLPLLDDKGNLFFKTRSELAFGPNGNGYALKHFYDKGLWDKWKKLGVQAINIILVDNLLANPFDAELLGYHTRKKMEVTIKSTKRLNEEEKVGLIGYKDNHVIVVEYSEIDEPIKGEPLANLSLFCVDMEFAKKVSQEKLTLHLAHKTAKYYADGKIKQPLKPNAWKAEFFIFDILPYSNQTGVLVYPRDECFAPLKNATGPDSPTVVANKLKMR